MSSMINALKHHIAMQLTLQRALLSTTKSLAYWVVLPTHPCKPKTQSISIQHGITTQGDIEYDPVIYQSYCPQLEICSRIRKRREGRYHITSCNREILQAYEKKCY